MAVVAVAAGTAQRRGAWAGEGGRGGFMQVRGEGQATSVCLPTAQDMHCLPSDLTESVLCHPACSRQLGWCLGNPGAPGHLSFGQVCRAVSTVGHPWALGSRPGKGSEAVGPGGSSSPRKGRCARPWGSQVAGGGSSSSGLSRLRTDSPGFRHHTAWRRWLHGESPQQAPAGPSQQGPCSFPLRGSKGSQQEVGVMAHPVAAVYFFDCDDSASVPIV